MKHKINIYYKDSLLFSESFKDLEEAKVVISLRIIKFPMSLLSLIRRKRIKFNDLQLNDFSFEYEELRLAKIQALKADLHYKSHSFWVHNFMRFCPNFRVLDFKVLGKEFYEPYQVKETVVATKIRNTIYGYTYTFKLKLK